MTRRRVAVLAPAAVLFAILVAHSLLETARDALFIARLGPERLALAYLVMAAAALGAIAVTRRWLRTYEPRRVVLMFLALATVGTTALAATIALSGALVFALYVWTGFVATLVVPSFWTAIDRSLQIVEAKRVFGAIGAGGVLGAMVGSAAAGMLGRVLPATSLVTAGAIAFALATAAAAALLPRDSAPEPAPREVRRELRSRSAVRYMRLLIVVAMIATIALTLGDLTFKSVMADRVAAGELATWFGAIYTVLNAIGLVIQIVVTPRLLARWGIGAALGVLPIIMLASALGFALSGAIVAVIALKLGDGSLRHSLHRIGSEILYMPVPAAVRDGGKLIADALGQRGGQAIAALIAGALVLLGDSARATAGVTAVFAVAWLGATVVARRAYVAQLRESLQAGEIQRDIALPPLDLASRDLLERSIASEDEVEALAALDLLARSGRLPASALRDSRENVIRHALSLLPRPIPSDVAEVLAELLHHPVADVRAAAVAASASRAHLVSALDDEAARVRAVALVHLASDDEHADLALARIERLMAGSEIDRRALADAIAFAPSMRFRGMLRELLDHGEPEVTRGVLRVLARAPGLADLDGLLPLLADARMRGDVRRVFIAAGTSATDVLIAALDAPATPVTIRRHLPRTLMLFPSSRAATALAARLPHEPDTLVQLKILRALGRMRADQPSLSLPLSPMREYLRRSLRDAARYALMSDQLDVLPESQTTALVRELVVDKQRFALEHAFRALGVIDPRAGWRTIHDAFASGDAARLPAARELVETLAPPDIRRALAAMIGELAPAERRERFGDLAPPRYRTRESLVVALLSDASESLRCAVVRLVAEHQIVDLRDTLARLRPAAGPPLVERAFDDAIARLHA